MDVVNFDITGITIDNINGLLPYDSVWYYSSQGDDCIRIRGECENFSSSDFMKIKYKVVEKGGKILPDYNIKNNNKRKNNMSNSIVMTSSYQVTDTDNFKANLSNVLGGKLWGNEEVMKKLEELSKGANKDESSLLATYKPKSEDSITVTSEDIGTTLTISESVGMNLIVTFVEEKKTGSGVTATVKHEETYPLGDSNQSDFLQITDALAKFDDGKKFAAKITSTKISEEKSEDQQSDSDKS